MATVLINHMNARQMLMIFIANVGSKLNEVMNQDLELTTFIMLHLLKIFREKSF